MMGRAGWGILYTPSGNVTMHEGPWTHYCGCLYRNAQGVIISGNDIDSEEAIAHRVAEAMRMHANFLHDSARQATMRLQDHVAKYPHA